MNQNPKTGSSGVKTLSDSQRKVQNQTQSSLAAWTLYLTEVTQLVSCHSLQTKLSYHCSPPVPIIPQRIGHSQGQIFPASRPLVC